MARTKSILAVVCVAVMLAAHVHAAAARQLLAPPSSPKTTTVIAAAPKSDSNAGTGAPTALQSRTSSSINKAADSGGKPASSTSSGPSPTKVIANAPKSDSKEGSGGAVALQSKTSSAINKAADSGARPAPAPSTPSAAALTGVIANAPKSNSKEGTGGALALQSRTADAISKAADGR